ncbi:hypothetical protein AKJ09_08552 [Labilithrix luteola]|uniref:Uncharacterized protein n=1 Tax=Labilithrix luteola TaxID=1391654 RepID=A0A0K1Q835_9BACT|nr:hypothetical protein AKJ09_08552 [Labilithrix luteola]
MTDAISTPLIACMLCPSLRTGGRLESFLKKHPARAPDCKLGE